MAWSRRASNHPKDFGESKVAVVGKSADSPNLLS